MEREHHITAGQPFNAAQFEMELAQAQGRQVAPPKIEHPNHVEIEASRRDLVSMLESRRQHWMGIMEISERQLQNAVDTIRSCDQQLMDLGENVDGA